jgi:uncharacterized protein DUF6252
MKNLFSLLVLIVVFTSCSEDISRPDRGNLQGLKDGGLWRTSGAIATLNTNGSLVITGGKQFETLTLKTTSTIEQTYPLGTSTSKQAIFVSTLGGSETTFSTGINKGDGQIIITEYDEVLKTVTGTFRFNAVDDSADPETGPIVNFIEGHFYKVPVQPAL